MTADAAALLLRETSCVIGLPDDPTAWTDTDRRRLASRVLADARHYHQAAQRAAANALTPTDPATKRGPSHD